MSWRNRSIAATEVVKRTRQRFAMAEPRRISRTAATCSRLTSPTARRVMVMIVLPETARVMV
jgi:hypothetical protein